mgnify:CR=1 FL=1
MVHPLYTNFAKATARLDRMEMQRAFSTWAFNPLKRYKNGLNRLMAFTHSNLSRYMSYWRLITQLFKNK